MSIATVVTQGYGSFGSVSAVVLFGYSIGETPPPPVPSTQAGGGGDYSEVQRERWLAWARSRRNRRQEPERVGEIQPVEAKELPKRRRKRGSEPEVVDNSALLLANLAAVRAAQQERSDALTGTANAAVDAMVALRLAAEQEDEDVAMLLLGL